MTSYGLYLLLLALQLSLLGQASDALGGHGGKVGVTSSLFAGLGGYAYAFATAAGALPMWQGVLVGVLTAVLLGGAISMLLLRLRDDDFLLGSLAAQLGLVEFLNNSEAFGGPLGIRNVPGGDTLAALVLLLATSLASGFALHSLLGRSGAFRESLHWLRDDSISALSIGISRKNLFMPLVALQALMGGLVGVSIVMAQGYAAPTTFGLSLSIAFLTVVYVAGTGGSPLAIYAGAVLIVGLGELVRSLALPAELIGSFQQMLIAFILLVVLLFKRRGLFGPRIEVGPSAGRLE